MLYKAFISIFVILSLGFLSGYIAGSPASIWYSELIKPSFQPPNWLFGPAWTILYILMGISFAIIWNSESSINRSKAIRLFTLQFLLNLAWTPTFFYFQNPTLALLIIIALLILIIATIFSFNKVNKLSSQFLIPYLLWVIFATSLNAAITYLN